MGVVKKCMHLFSKAQARYEIGNINVRIILVVNI